MVYGFCSHLITRSVPVLAPSSAPSTSLLQLRRASGCDVLCRFNADTLMNIIEDPWRPQSEIEMFTCPLGGGYVMTLSIQWSSLGSLPNFGVGSDFPNLRARADEDVVGDAIWFNATGHHHIPPETRGHGQGWGLHHWGSTFSPGGNNSSKTARSSQHICFSSKLPDHERARSRSPEIVERQKRAQSIRVCLNMLCTPKPNG